ncbi:MAG: DUF3592 domain-containing protein [Verrucomicrobiales bacterium]
MTEHAVALRTNRLASALGGAFFGLFLAVIGAVFCWYLWSVFQKARAMDAWVSVPCTILESRVEQTPPVPNSAASYRAIVQYRYEFGGARYSSEKIKRVSPASSSWEKMERLRARFAAGTNVTCYVNPANPAQAVLIKDSKAAAYTLWFPAIFVVGGLGLVLSAILRQFRP